MPGSLRALLLLLCLTLGWTACARAQTPTPTPTTTPSPVVVPMDDVAASAESTLQQLDATVETVRGNSDLHHIETDLRALEVDVNAHKLEDSQSLGGRPTLQLLETTWTDWQPLADRLSDWSHQLADRIAELDRAQEELQSATRNWTATRDEARKQGAATAVIGRIDGILASATAGATLVDERRKLALRLQAEVVDQANRVERARDRIRQARDATLGQIFVQDSPPLWSAELRAAGGSGMVTQMGESVQHQWASLLRYLESHQDRVVLHLLLVAVFTLLFAAMRVKVEGWVATEPAVEISARVFRVPWAIALVLSISLSGWLYPEAPRIFRALLGAAAVVPSIVILSRLLERQLLPILFALVGLYSFDQLGVVLAPLPLPSRILFFAEMLGALVFALWLLRGAGSSYVRRGARAAAAVFAAALCADTLGYVGVATLIGDAVVSAADAAVVLFAVSRILDGMLMFAFRIPPLSKLHSVANYRPLWRHRCRMLLACIGVVVWTAYVLQLLTLRGALLRAAHSALTATLSIGALTVTPGDVLAFGFSVWAAFALSRFLRFVLDEDVYPHAQLESGVPYAISTMTHYAIIIVGLMAGLAALGVDTTKFAVLAGSLGVGLGFGLQNIVQNFVSGLILLFERPVKVGDVVQIGSLSGTVQRIGIRASVIRTSDMADIIVPNAKLISDELTNWTLSNRRRGFEILVGVAYGTEPEPVLGLLLEAARSHPGVAGDDAEPTAILVEFGADALNFKLRACAEQAEHWLTVRSEVTVDIYRRLGEAGIAIPNTQRDIHLVSVDEGAASALGRHPKTDGVSQPGQRAIEVGAAPDAALEVEGAHS